MRARDDTLHRLLIVITLHANKVLHQRRFRTHTRCRKTEYAEFN